MNPLALLVAAAQGSRLRRTVERLSPADGPTAGSVPGRDGPALRLLVFGDSTAAGVGAEDHETALVGSLAREVARDTRSAVEWRVIAHAGATSRRVRHSLLRELDEEHPFDLAVLLVGVNDVLARRRVDQWHDDVAVILDQVVAQAELVVMTGVPPFDRFPSMPRTLGRYLAGQGRRLDEVAKRLCQERRRIKWIDSTELLPDDQDFFARDGFHPSPAGYRTWAQAIWQHAASGSDMNARRSS